MTMSIITRRNERGAFAMMALVVSISMTTVAAFTTPIHTTATSSHTIPWAVTVATATSSSDDQTTNDVPDGPKRNRNNRRQPRGSSSSYPDDFVYEIPKSIPQLSQILKQTKRTPASKQQLQNSKPTQSKRSPSTAAASKESNVKKSKSQWSKRIQAQEQEMTRSATKPKAAPQRPKSTPQPKARRKNPTNPPFEAPFWLSMQTQRRIQQLDEAHLFLQHLLTTPKTSINAANVLGALSYSAKSNRYDADKVAPLLLQMGELTREMMYSNATVNNRQLANAAWAFAKHANRNPQLDLSELDAVTDDLADTMVERLASAEKFELSELCMAAWAYGVLRHRKRPPGWANEPQVARIGKEDEVEVKFQPFRKGSRMEEDENQEMTPFIPVHDDTPSERLLQAIAVALDEGKRVQNCSWSELANLAWAYASHGTSHGEPVEKLLRQVCVQATERLRSNASGTPLARDIAQLVWAMGTHQTDNFRLADSLVELIGGVSAGFLPSIRHTVAFHQNRPFQRWSCPDLVQIAESLAHARIDAQPLLQAIYEEAGHRVMEGLYVALPSQQNPSTITGRRSFLPWELSVLLWAQARLHLTEAEHEVFADFPPAAMKCLGSDPPLGPQEQANVAWALTVLMGEEDGATHTTPQAVRLLQSIFQSAAQHAAREKTLQMEHAHQLWQSYALLREDVAASMDVPTWFTDYLRTEWVNEKSREKISSARHRSLSMTLTLMGIDHYNEHHEDIDVAIVLRPSASWTHETDDGYHNGHDNDQYTDDYGSFEDFEDDGDWDNIDWSPSKTQGRVSVAVEFDGPNHFTRELSEISKPRALGHSVLKYRMLNRQGWTVVRVPYYEWDKIPFWASMERQRYLQRKLKTHAKIEFSEVDRSNYATLPSSRKTRFD